MKLQKLRSWGHKRRSSANSEGEGAPVVAPAELASPEALLEKELSATFAVFDRDADGRISKSELRAVLSSLGDDLSGAELDELMARVDGDGDGYIDMAEFISFHTERKSVRANRGLGCGDETFALQAAFDVFDADKDGFISAEELRRVMCSLGDDHTSLEECRHMISCVDKDGDLMVDFTEFQGLMSDDASS